MTLPRAPFVRDTRHPLPATRMPYACDPYIPHARYLYGNEVIQFMPPAPIQQAPLRRSRRTARLPVEDDGGFVDAGPAWAAPPPPPPVPVPEPVPDPGHLVVDVTEFIPRTCVQLVA